MDSTLELEALKQLFINSPEDKQDKILISLMTIKGIDKVKLLVEDTEKTIALSKLKELVKEKDGTLEEDEYGITITINTYHQYKIENKEEGLDVEIRKIGDGFIGFSIKSWSDAYELISDSIVNWT